MFLYSNELTNILWIFTDPTYSVAFSYNITDECFHFNVILTEVYYVILD